MPTVAVLEPAPLLAPLLSRVLPPDLGTLAPPDRPAGLLVLAPGAGAPPCPDCRVLLTPGRTLSPGPPSVVSYGPSPRDTLTFSSLRDGGMVLALQRELVTLAGRRVERQEAVLPLRGEPMLTLAWAGALLLAGVEPEDLGDLARRAFS